MNQRNFSDAEISADALISLVAPMNLESDPDYRKAVEFIENVEFQEGVDYEWVSVYAEKTFEGLVKVYDRLDEKAGEIIKYLGGSTGLLTLVGLFNITQKNCYILFFCVPSFLCALGSIFLAALTRIPDKVDFPPSVEGALAYANNYRNDGEAKAKFLGQWHAACMSFDVATERKAKLVKHSTFLFFAATAWLIVPLVAVLVANSFP